MNDIMLSSNPIHAPNQDGDEIEIIDPKISVKKNNI